MRRFALWSARLLAGLLIIPTGAALAEQDVAAANRVAIAMATQASSPGPFTVGEIRAFLAARQKAMAIADPMQRCLHYPDPPGSHWTREGVAAYCRFRLQPTVTSADLKSLLESGRGAEIDHRLGEWARQPQEYPESFWRLINENFLRPDPDVRVMLEAWKQQSPKSAFAYAASGYNFLQAAWSARGGDFIQETPRSKIEAMDALLARADGDLRMSIKLDPSLALPHAAMIEIGTMEGDDAYAAEATKRGQALDIPSLPVYEKLALAAEPRWGGSLSAQSSLIGSIGRNTSRNALLPLVRAKVLGEQLGVGCYCASPQDDAAYRTVFDQVASRTELNAAGNSALENKQYVIALVYLSEASRFDTPDVDQKLKEALAHLEPEFLGGH